jgi:uncharacterized protein DUF3108
MTFGSFPEQDRCLPSSPRIPTCANRPHQAKAWLAGFCAAAFLALAPLPASAQGRLEAHYEASLAGISVGRGTWGIEIGEDYYSAAAQGATAGLLKAFSSGTGSGSVQGRIVNGALVPAAYIATVSSKKSETIKINLAGGGVKDFSIEPEPPVDPDRVVVTPELKKGVVDPMTSSLVRVPGNGELLGPDACRSATSVFDGRLRYDLKLDFKRIETVKTGGYHGPAVVCAIYFTPVAGYIPDRPVIKHLAGERRMEVVLVPISGTRVLVPIRTVIPTPFGPAVLEATQFNTVALPPRVAKTQ